MNYFKELFSLFQIFVLYENQLFKYLPIIDKIELYENKIHIKYKEHSINIQKNCR